MLRNMSQSVRWAFNWKEWNPNENEFAHAISCIQSEEKERLGSFVFRKDVRASLAGRLLMRKFVNEYGRVPYNGVTLGRDANNKPVATNVSTNLCFNVSHQGDYTVLAGETRNVNLGVDLMKLEYTGGKSLSEFFRLMNRIFSPSEWDEIRDTCLDESGQIAMFCRHWALKESYVKALGVGITVDLGAIDFKTNTKLSEDSVATDTVLYLNGVKQNWLFEETLLNSEHCVAVALEGSNEAQNSRDNTFKMISSADLLANSVPLFPQDPEYVEQYFKKEEHP